MHRVLIPMVDESMIGEARREVAALATEVGLDETERGRAAIVATELATNLFRHATGGLLFVHDAAGVGGSGGVEILALDRGPGIEDLSRCMRDGFSTGMGTGIGLGAVRRLSDEFDIHSSRPAGTAVVARVMRAAGAQRPALHRSAISVPAPNETECGDAYCINERGSTVAFMVADGLGHGPSAAAAARKAVELFLASDPPEPDAFLAGAQEALRHTRGAAIAALRLDLTEHRVRYAGIGNIAARLIGAERSQGLVSIGGTVGLERRRVQGFDHEWPPGGVLVMHSDGLGSRWNLRDDPTLPGRHPAIIAAVLYRDHGRGSDDVTVLVARLRAGPSRHRGLET